MNHRHDRHSLAQASLFDDGAEDTAFLSDQLITYIGNKRRLLPMITEALQLSIKSINQPTISFADVFAGTGVVSRLARRWANKLYINDFEAYSAFSNEVYQSNQSAVDLREVEIWRNRVERIAADSPQPGFITELYAPKDEGNIAPQDRVFYTRRNAVFIDTTRAAIDDAPEHVRSFLLAPLIQRASVHVNTSGVFKGFYKNKEGIGQFGGTMRNALQRILAPISIPLPVLSNFERDVSVTQMEAAQFVSTLPDDLDIAYFDPPYNQHPYGSNYFMLNLILHNQRPQRISRISGIPNEWQRSAYNSKYEAAPTLQALLEECPAKVLLISYSSEGFITPDEMFSILRALGNVEVFDQAYNTFRGCRNLSNRPKHLVEMLFKVERL